MDLIAPAAEPSLRGRRLGLSYESRANLFCRDLTEGLVEAAAARGVEVLVRECARSPQRQLADLAELLDAGIDALVLSPEDPHAVAPTLAAAQRRGLPVFTVDRAAAGPVVSHVTSDNRHGGRLAGDVLAQALGGRGAVAIVSLPASSVAERVRGFREAVAVYPDLRVVEDVDGGSERQRAQAVTIAVLQAYPDLRGLFAVNDVTVQGALAALRAAGRWGDVVLVGYDATPQGCAELLRDGPLRAEVAQFPARLGQAVVDLWADYCAGRPLPARVEIPVELVTRANAARFSGAERLLHTRRGEVRVADERVVLFPVRGYQVLLDEIHRASPDLLRHIVYRSGFALGERIAARVRERYADPQDALAVLLEDLAQGGFGTFELVSFDADGGEAQVVGRGLFEASSASALAWARSPRCVDLYCSGRLAGALTVLWGRPAACEELWCQARGDPHCLFVLTPW